MNEPQALVPGQAGAPIQRDKKGPAPPRRAAAAANDSSDDDDDYDRMNADDLGQVIRSQLFEKFVPTFFFFLFYPIAA